MTSTVNSLRAECEIKCSAFLLRLALELPIPYYTDYIKKNSTFLHTFYSTSGSLSVILSNPVNFIKMNTSAKDSGYEMHVFLCRPSQELLDKLCLFP